MALAREERRFGGVSPGNSGCAGYSRGTRRRRLRGLRRTYALGAVGPGAEDGRGGVDHVEDGTGRPAFAPAVAGRLAVARGVRPGRRAGEEGGEGPLTDLVEGASCGLIRPDASFSGMGKKGLTSAFF